ncbi:MAG: dephospho-CoA kinase [Alphaproteobacteria bacterium BRH_c36]|nr:MAG: dephospho-CoA kinase [Alphaproteobacteria bacterium BRH_c36]
MLIVGLTGSIGMGKSTAAAVFREHGFAVFDADACVHGLYSGKAVPLIEAAFPGATETGQVDRGKLSAALLADESGFQRLEAIVHPLVRDAEREFLHIEFALGAPVAVLEIPLLYETGADALVDVVVVVSTDPQTQIARVLERPGMTREKLDQIRSRQIPDNEKRARADYVVDTGASLSQSRAELDSIIAALKQRQPQAYQRHWA